MKAPKGPLIKDMIKGYIPFNWATEKFEMAPQVMNYYIRNRLIDIYYRDQNTKMVSEIDIKRCLRFEKRKKDREKDIPVPQEKLICNIISAILETVPGFAKVPQVQYDQFEAAIRKALDGMTRRDYRIDRILKVQEKAVISLISLTRDKSITREELNKAIEKIEQSIQEVL